MAAVLENARRDAQSTLCRCGSCVIGQILKSPCASQYEIRVTVVCVLRSKTETVHTENVRPGHKSSVSISCHCRCHHHRHHHHHIVNLPYKFCLWLELNLNGN